MAPGDPEGNDSDASFELLDRYLQLLHAGEQPDRNAILADHPELASFLDCLEILDEMARPASQASDSRKTIDAGGRSGDPAILAEEVRFGKYHLMGEVGRGGMGVIYKARQEDLDRTVAIKMILSSHLASPQQVERFVAEARTMARVRHPNIVRIHETGELHGQHYFVMEYITGPSLAAALGKRNFTHEVAARLVAQVARAVQHLHEAGIVHRDLKPSNVLLDEQGQPYVTDFGMVKTLGSRNATASGAIVGTPAYMAPEQAIGRAEQVGPHSDVYSLGAILYELIAGRPPFQGESALDTLVQVIESEPTRPGILNPHLPRPLESICLKRLDKDPAQRYPSALAVAEDLERFLGGDEVEAGVPGLLHQIRRWARREPALVYRLGGLAVLVVIVELNYLVARTVSLTTHLEVLGLLAAWMLASAICQQWLNRAGRAELARLAWVGADVILLTALLALIAGQEGPLLIGYPFVIVASGLWFQVRLVWFTTVVCETAYALLILAWPSGVLFWRMPHYHAIFMVALAVLGFVVAYQVQRIRALNRYYENRPLP